MGEGSPTKIDRTKWGALILTSLLEDLVDFVEVFAGYEVSEAFAGAEAEQRLLLLFRCMFSVAQWRPFAFR